MKKPFPDGHFYSPIVNFSDISRSESRLWPENPEVLEIDFNAAGHKKFLEDHFPTYLKAYDYPDVRSSGMEAYSFYTANSEFSWLDCRTHFVMLQVIRPTQLIEIGSGFSSLLSADVNCRFLQNSTGIICIEPYPREFLTKNVPGLGEVIQEKVEDIPLSLFDRLRTGDILFIDSSHVAKTGSDVNHIYFEIIPRLKPGVVIHIHDIFLPFEYKKEWVMNEGRSWNEQYLLRALLMYNDAFEVLFGCMFAFSNYPSQLKRVLNGHLFGGSSFWIRKKK